MPRHKILIIGAGLGGLCLAQGLRRSNADVRIFERDSSPWDRPQGYRLHLEADALNSLREVLQPELHALFEATAMRTQPYTTILSTDLRIVKRIPTPDGQDARHWPDFQSAEPLHCNVDRATLREILLTGLGDKLSFKKPFTHYESRPDGITAFFADGTSETGDVLIGADGIRSPIRKQRAPHARSVYSGVLAIYGRVPMNVAKSSVPREAVEDIFSIASYERKVFLGMGAVEFPARPDDASKKMYPEAKLKPRENYMVCIVGGRRENFSVKDEALNSMSSSELQSLAADMLSAWPAEAAMNFVANGDPQSFFAVNMYTSVPCDLDAPKDVTFIGDAIHAMTPTLGRGANLAMRDGALLSRHLNAYVREEVDLATALGDYENEMLPYSFDVVRESVQIGQQRMNQNPLPRLGATNG